MKAPTEKICKADQLFRRAQVLYGAKAFPLLLKAAKLGHEEAQVLVGYDYAYGITQKFDGAKAFLWWKRAYKQGSGVAAFNFGMFFRDSKEWTKALKWFERAVDAGDKDGLVEIAKIHLRYAGNRAAGLRYLKRALAAKNKLTAPARLKIESLLKEQEALSPGDLLHMKADLLDEKKQYAKALPLLLKGAKMGNSSCQILLASYLCSGMKGVPKNLARGIYWDKQAYKNGWSIGAHNLAVTYRNEGNPVESYRWFERAVKAGDAESNLDLAKIWLYERGDKAKAIQHLEAMFTPSANVSEGGRDEARTLLRRLSMPRN